MTRTTKAFALFLIVSTTLAGTAMEASGAASKPAIIPQPVQMSVQEGVFSLTPTTVVVAGKALEAEGRQLAAMLSPATGYALPVLGSGKRGAPAMELRLDASPSNLGEEGYELQVTARKVTVRARKPAGLFYAFQTLRQLLPPQIFRRARVAGVEWNIPCVLIRDYPRFPWRGALLDTARHFMPKESVLKFTDLLALHKMNTLQLHLTDDQGWRIEIGKYPKLTEVGAWRKETLVGRLTSEKAGKLEYDGRPHGGFYTQDDIREIVEYARERHINVVPEVEMPGHAQAAIAAYPELGCTNEPVEVLTKWGVSAYIFNVREQTIAFLQDVLTEVIGLFPSRYIHTGGDEAVKTQWKSSPEMQARIKELGLENEAELQAYFTRRMEQFLSSKGRRLIGWDEILEGGLAPGATVMSWRGEKGGIAAAKAGHDVVMSPTTHTYLDYYQSKDRTKEPLAIGGYVPLETVYGFEPISKEIPPEYAKHVLGAQAQLWTEYIPSPKQAEYMMFPRAGALAEVTWTPREKKDFADFQARLSAHLERLKVLDVNYRPLEGPR